MNKPFFLIRIQAEKAKRKAAFKNKSLWKRSRHQTDSSLFVKTLAFGNFALWLSPNNNYLTLVRVVLFEENHT